LEVFLSEHSYAASPAGAAAYESGTVPIHCSGWATVAPAPTPSHVALQQDIEADVAVIGAGLAGASLALHLAERGVSVALLEARQPADGASGRNAGHVQPFLDQLQALAGWPGGGQPFIDFFTANRDIVFELCQKHGIDGDARACGMVEAAFKPQAAFKRKAAEWRERGYRVQEVGGSELKRLLGTEAYGHGLHWQEGGRVNPYMFTNGMVTAAQRLGARVFGDSPVQGCERVGQRWRLRTPTGSVLAGKVVICTNAHAGNTFYPELGRTQYPLVACALATKPLPRAVLESVNPAQVALTQVPTGLYPMVIDGFGRMITATIPRIGRAADAQLYFGAFLRYLHRTFPQTRDTRIELESFWTGTTSSSSHVYHQDYAKIYRVDDGVLALMNLGTWGNVMGPLLGRHLAEVMVSERWQDLLLPLEAPQAVRFPDWFAFKVRRLMMPAARAVERLGLA
jgi:glycine/D-amino acid oxidase-like deaminating enzyme